MARILGPVDVAHLERDRPIDDRLGRGSVHTRHDDRSLWRVDRLTAG
jgi:hypothetical protein